MATINELREKRARAWESAKEFLESKRGGDGLVSAGDSAIYDKMETDIMNLGREIERLEKQRDFDSALSEPTARPILSDPSVKNAPAGRRASDDYKSAYGNMLRGRGASNILQEGIDADGGYIVPAEYERKIIESLDEANVVRQIATVIQTGGTRKIPVSGTGSTASYVVESGIISESGITFSQITLDAYKATDRVRVSTELLQDSMFDVETYIMKDFVRAFAALEEQKFCVGSGTGEPTGIFDPVAGGQIGVTLTSPSAISYDNIIDIIYSLKAPYRRNAAFLTANDTIKSLRKLKDSNGQYLWQPSLQIGQPDRLGGYPLHTSPYAPAVGAGTIPLAFGDFKYFWIADRAGRTLQRLNELYAENGQVGFLATERHDAKVILPEAIQLIQMGT